MKMVTKTVEVYRLWPNNTWDKVEISIEVPQQMFDNDEFVESQAVQRAWLNLLNQEEKPYQIGLYMLSLYGATKAGLT